MFTWVTGLRLLTRTRMNKLLGDHLYNPDDVAGGKLGKVEA